MHIKNGIAYADDLSQKICVVEVVSIEGYTLFLRFNTEEVKSLYKKGSPVL